MELRAATVADIAAVVALWHDFGAVTRAPAGAAHVQRLLDHDARALVVAVDEDRIIGSVVVGWDGWRCHLYRLVVRPEARRRGVARTLVAAARDRAHELGASRVDAMVLRDNDGASAFWRAAGFLLQDDDCRWSAPA